MKVVEISNRIVIPEPGKANAGGLDAALSHAPSGVEMIRFGWSGKLVQDSMYDPNKAVHTTKKDDITYVTVDLPERVFNGFYNSIANQYWWPLLHGRNDLTIYSRDDADFAKDANSIFASALQRHVIDTKLIDKDTPIRVHDYHFLDLGWELRKRGIENPTSFFLHVPIPDKAVIANQSPEASNYASQQFKKLYAYDAVGVQAPRDLENLFGVLGRDGDIKIPPFYHSIPMTNPVNGNEIRMGVYPVMGHTETYRREAEKMVGSRAVWEKLQEIGFTGKLEHTTISYGRLDHTKDLVGHYEASDLALSQYGQSSSSFHLLQIAAYGRSAIPAYNNEFMRINTAHNDLTEKFGKVATLHTAAIKRDLILGMARRTRAGLLTSPWEGAGLVAYEYVAAQDPKNPGVLILSKGAGSAAIIPSNGALMVDPGDRHQLARAMVESGKLSLETRQGMYARSMEAIETYPNKLWYTELVQDSVEVHQLNRQEASRSAAKQQVFNPRFTS